MDMQDILLQSDGNNKNLLEKDIYLDYSKILSYPFLFCFLMGQRGGGKTYGFKQWAINDFLKNGKQFIYLRRYKNEFKKIKTFFNDISLKYPEHKFNVKGKEFYIDDKLAGYGSVLSTSMMEKSNPFPNVNKIGFDEYIIPQGNVRYLHDEVFYFLEFYETVSRLRDDVRVIFMANAISHTNPYSLYFKINVQKGKFTYDRKRYILAVNYSNEKYTQEKESTKFGKLIKGTDYGKYAVENEFYLDNESFIQKRPSNSHLTLVLRYNGKTIGMWSDNIGFHYISEKIYPTDMQFGINISDTNENFMYLNKTGSVAKMIKRIFQSNGFRYESIDLKNIMYEIYRKLAI